MIHGLQSDASLHGTTRFCFADGASSPATDCGNFHQGSWKKVKQLPVLPHAKPWRKQMSQSRFSASTRCYISPTSTRCGLSILRASSTIALRRERRRWKRDCFEKAQCRGAILPFRRHEMCSGNISMTAKAEHTVSSLRKSFRSNSRPEMSQAWRLCPFNALMRETCGWRQTVLQRKASRCRQVTVKTPRRAGLPSGTPVSYLSIAFYSPDPTNDGKHGKPPSSFMTSI